MQSANRKLYLKSLGIATLIEVVVLLLTLAPMADGLMTHSAAAAAQRPLLTQFLGWFGMMFHFPSLILTFWFPPLAPIVQIFILSGLVYLRFCTVKKRSGEDGDRDLSAKDEVSRRYWL